MYQQQGDVKKALEYYQHYFECARSEKENKKRKLIDQARVIVGIAKADLTMGIVLILFLGLPNLLLVCIEDHIKKTINSFQNIKPLIDWKSKTGDKK